MISLKPAGTLYYNDSTVDMNGALVQVTSASISRQRNVPTLNSYYLPFLDDHGTATSPIKLGDGTYTFNGEITFELTNGTVNQLFKSSLFSRSSWFSVTFFDGERRCGISNCVWSNLTISCASGGAATMSISYMSNNGYQDRLLVDSTSGDFSYNDNDLLIPYWKCGHDDFLDFSINFSRNVSPVFLNNDLVVPSYLRPGLIEVSMNATTLKYIGSWSNTINVKIGESHGITLLKAILQTTQYNMSSMSDTGAKTYAWNSIAETARGQLFSIY